MTKEELQNKKQLLNAEIKRIDEELNRLHWESVHKIWGNKLKIAESEVEDMVANKEIRPYFGGHHTSAYMHLIQIVSEHIFDFQLSTKDVLSVLNTCLPLIEGYHSSVDPNRRSH